MNRTSTLLLLAIGLALSCQSVARAQETADTAPSDAAPSDAAPSDAAPSDAAPSDAAPSVRAPVEGEQTEPEQAEAEICTSPGWTTEHRDLLRLTGAALFIGLPWLLSSVLISPLAGWSLDGGYEPEWEEFRFFGLVPVAGPWIQMVVKPDGLGSDGWVVDLMLNGLFQAVGFVLLVWDLIAPEYRYNVYESVEVECEVAIGVSPGGLQIMGAF